MCGIVGSVSNRNIVPILVQGLQRLEYRGYDSCGIAIHAGGLKRARTTSRVAELETQFAIDKAAGRPFEGYTGIAYPFAKIAGLGISVGLCGVATTVSLGAMAIPCAGVIVSDRIDDSVFGNQSCLFSYAAGASR